MQEIFEIEWKEVRSPADAMAAMEAAATGHAQDLGIGFERMRSDYGVLWMIVRSRLSLVRLPEGKLRIKTWLRNTKAAVSNRDFAFFDDSGELGFAVQSWVLVDAQRRSIVNMKTVPILWNLPVPQPERTQVLRHISMPAMTTVGQWHVTEDELDLNGHLNNVSYVKYAQRYAPLDSLNLDVIFERECFAGETLTLQASDGYVCGLKEDGQHSFRAHFYKGEPI